jgi:hypothetical protein
MTHLGGDVRQLTSLLPFHLLSHRLKVPLHSIDPDRDAVDDHGECGERGAFAMACFASTGVKTPVTMFPNSEDAKIKFLKVNVRTAWTEAPHLAASCERQGREVVR